jgi:hypothetical protein
MQQWLTDSQNHGTIQLDVTINSSDWQQYKQFLSPATM